MKLLRVAIVHLALLAAFLFWLMPRPEGKVTVVQGIALAFNSCSSKSCDSGVQVGKNILACTADPIGTHYGCGEFFEQARMAQATYFPMPTLLSHLGISNPANILLRFEQNGVVLKEYSRRQVMLSYIFPGGIMTFGLFGLSFMVFARRAWVHRSADRDMKK